MQETPACVVASVEGMCMSAATLLFLTADVCEVSEHSHFMFHTYSSGNWGKGSDQLANVMADDKWARHLFNQVYKGFFPLSYSSRAPSLLVAMLLKFFHCT